MKFIWIDDSPIREQAAENMAKSLNIEVQFIGIQGKSLSDELSKMIVGVTPDLIIIDHNLEDSLSGIFNRGSSAAASIRETWPDCPIICVSGIDVTEVDSQQKALYEEIFSIDTISDHYLKILSIAESFRLIKEKDPQNLVDLLPIIQVPSIDEIKLSTVIPKLNYHDKSLPVRVSKWVRSTLIKRPGFLYDKLWVSTFIGIKPESFYKVEGLFASAEYKGIFNNPEDQRWWKSKIISILFDNSDLSGLPWHKGRGLKNLIESDFSISYATQKIYPDTVAYVDSSSDAIQVPVLIKESIMHPEYESLLYFEDIRLMKPAE